MSINLTENNSDIFSKGALIQLSASIWTGRRKLPSSYIKGAKDPNFITASKYLIDKDYLKKIEQVRNEARSWLYSKSLPFPIDGVLFIPKGMISDVNERLTKFEETFAKHVGVFTSNYSKYVQLAQDNLGELYDAQDYPQDIGRKFGLSWRFFVLDAPGKAGLLAPELYEKEEAKFHKTMEEFQNTAMNTLRTTFAEMIDRIVDRLRDNKKFRDTTVTNLSEFLDDFAKLNITNDEAMAELVEKSKGVLRGVIPQELRDNEALRTTVAEQMKEVQDVLEASLVDRPRRLIRA